MLYLSALNAIIMINFHFCISLNSGLHNNMTWFIEGLPDLSYQCEGYGLWVWASGDQLSYMLLIINLDS